MAEIASAFVSLLPSAKGFGSKLEGQVGGEVNASGKRLGSSFGKMFAVAGGVLAAAGIGSFLKGSIGEAREAQKVGALTAQVLKTTGHAAKISATQVGALSTAISNKTGIDDEAIQSGANLLLTFTHVRNEVGKGNKVFNQATQLATDMSAALGTDAKSAALQLGKALNDPAKGVTRLARSGVSFTEQQTEQIKKMQESGDLLGAQKIILGEVSREFGGAAAAQATAGEKMSVAWGNLKEQIGTALLPVLDKLEVAISSKVIPALSKFVDAAGPALGRFGKFLAPFVSAVKSSLSDVIKAFSILSGSGSVGDRIDGFAEVLDHAFGNSGRLVGPIRTVSRVVGDVIKAFKILFEGGSIESRIDGFAEVMDHAFGNTGGLVTPIRAVASAIQQIIPAVNEFGAQAITVFQAQVLPVLKQMSTTFTTVILPAISSLVSYVATSLWPVFLQVVGIIRDNVIPIISSFASFIYTVLYPAIVRIVSAIAQNLKPVFDQLVATFQNSVLPALQKLLVKFREWQPTIQRIIVVVAAIVGKLLIFAAAVLGKVLPVVIKFAGWLLTKLVPAVAAIIGIVIKVIAKVLEFANAFIDAIPKVAKFVAAVSKKIGQVVKFVSEIPGKVVSALGDLSQTLLNSGKALLSGFAQGIRDKATAVYDEAKKMLSKVKNLFPHSPAKEGPFSGRGWVLYSGQTIAEALAKGISDKAPKAVKAAFNMVSRIKDQIDTLMDSFGQLKDSIASTFTSGLFDATNRGDFFSNLLAKRADLTKLAAAFRKLNAWGLNPNFLSALFQSGNGALILDLASGSAAQARQDSALYGQVQGLAGQLGSAVATDVYGPQIVNRLDALTAAVNKLPGGLGGVINGTAAKGKKKSR